MRWHGSSLGLVFKLIEISCKDIIDDFIVVIIALMSAFASFDKPYVTNSFCKRQYPHAGFISLLGVLFFSQYLTYKVLNYRSMALAFSIKKVGLHSVTY